MKVNQVIWEGVAVHTRDIKPGQDYGWQVQTGDTQLFKKIEEIHRLALRDIDGDAPVLAVLLDKKRVGFLIGELPSPRIDHSNRVIHNTLYLEFDKTYQQYVLPTVATLLQCSKNTYKPHAQHFSDYAEIFFENSPNRHLKTVNLPDMCKQPSSDLKKITHGKLALFSNSENRNRCARYLMDFSSHNNCTFISTGRLSLDKCQQVAKKSDECILLTLSSDVESEVELKKSLFSFGKSKALHSFL